MSGHKLDVGEYKISQMPHVGSQSQATEANSTITSSHEATGGQDGTFIINDELINRILS